MQALDTFTSLYVRLSHSIPSITLVPSNTFNIFLIRIHCSSTSVSYCCTSLSNEHPTGWTVYLVAAFRVHSVSPKLSVPTFQACPMRLQEPQTDKRERNITEFPEIHSSPDSRDHTFWCCSRSQNWRSHALMILSRFWAVSAFLVCSLAYLMWCDVSVCREFVVIHVHVDKGWSDRSLAGSSMNITGVTSH